MTEDRDRHFKIAGMDCAEEVAVLKQALGPLVGGEDHLAFDLLQSRLTIRSAAHVESNRIIDAVAKTGMRAEPWTDGARAAHQASFWKRSGRSVLTLVSGLAILIGLAAQVWMADGLTGFFTGEHRALPWPLRLNYGLATIAGAWYVFPKALYSARRFRPDMNLLMIIAITGAIIIGEWLEAATVSFLFSLSLLLESWSVGRARQAVAALTELAPAEVRLINDQQEESIVAPEDVELGATFVVKPGERIPLDGQIVAGESHVNQAPITGESSPVAKRVGAEVFAGTINGDGVLRVRSTKPAEDTTLARVIRLVSEAGSKKAPSERWIEKFARIYTPTIMVLAIAVLIVPPLLLGEAWSDWFYNSLVLLVIACPCALVISTPVTIVSGLATAARQGVLVKGGVYLESVARLKAIAFDKTGTLTHGQPTVVEIIPINDHSERELIERALALESHSEHPLARAIVRFSEERQIEAPPADNLQVIRGMGATGTIQDRLYWIGSREYLAERGQASSMVDAELEKLSARGRTIVVVGNEQHVCGVIGITDAVRSNVRQVIDRLRSAGVHHLIMLTGDNVNAAEAIADQVGMTEYRSELRPEEKIAAIESMVDEYGDVAMVGDGVNDAPALARATIGIAMGAIGTDAAIETADIALMTDDLSRIPWLVQHARRTLKLIRQNVIFALGIKAFFLALSIGGLATLWMAIAADTGAALLVVFNGMRMLYPRSLD